MGLTENVLDLLWKWILKVQIGKHELNLFLCNVGVRQGENLSPFLFSLYINDLESFLQSNEMVGFNCSNLRGDR